MIFIHQPAVGAGATLLERRIIDLQDTIPEDTIWLDLIRPSREEELKVEAFAGIEVPTREEMKDIEPSELLYVEDGARYMTGRVLSKVSDAEEPGLAGITFILRGNRLVTVLRRTGRPEREVVAAGVGADLLVISSAPQEQADAYDAVVGAVRSGEFSSRTAR